MAAEGVDRSGSSFDFPTMRYTLRNKVLFSRPDENPLSVDDHRIAALHNDHVFIKVVDMFRRRGVLAACPERHLAPIASIKNVTLDARRRLTRRSNPIGGMFHEFGKAVHVHALWHRPTQSATCNLAPHSGKPVRKYGRGPVSPPVANLI